MSRDDDEHYVANKVPGRIYGSRAFNVDGYVRTDQALEKVVRKARYLDRVFPDIDGDVLGIVRHEQVLRTTPTGKRQVKLLLIEDPRGIRTACTSGLASTNRRSASCARSRSVPACWSTWTSRSAGRCWGPGARSWGPPRDDARAARFVAARMRPGDAFRATAGKPIRSRGEGDRPQWF